MVTKEEVETAKALWEQAKVSVALANSAWGLLEQSQNSLLESIVRLGFTAAQAQQAFKGLRAEHRESVDKAVRYMATREQEYSDLRQAFEAQRS